MIFKLFAGVGCFLPLVVIAAGCAASYDQSTDDSLTKAQSLVDGHVQQLEANAPTTQPSDFDYTAVDSDLHSLSVRVQARSSSDPSIKAEAQAIDEYKSVVDGLPALEKTASATQPVAGAVWDTAQKQLDAAVQAILALELQRKK